MSDGWSRRREAARAEAEALARAGAARGEAGDAAALAALPEDEQLARLGLPDPDTVVSGDDVAAFLARAVPRAIRNRALRSLWRSNPVLACVDGLNDYDGDFTGDGLRGEALRTTYSVGKGLARHVEHLAAARSEEDAGALSDENGRVDAGEEPDEKGLAEAPDVVERSPPEPAAEEVAAPVTASPPVRRMRFTFGEDDTA